MNYISTLSEQATSEIAAKIGLETTSADYIVIVIKADGETKQILPAQVNINPDDFGGTTPLSYINITYQVQTPQSSDSPPISPLENIMKTFALCKRGGRWVQC